MTHILSLGAINKQTGEYVYPKIANKKDDYICPDCNKDLILCQGEIIRPYFRHKVDSVNPCHHYSNPTESQIHKDGKMVMKSLLERKIPMSFVRNCCSCKKSAEINLPKITEGSIITLEHRFNYEDKLRIADVAHTINGEIKGIYEICNTHKTCSEDRPEPWVEIDAETLIKLANDNNLSQIKIPCIRCEKCNDCIEKKLKKEIRCEFEYRSDGSGYIRIPKISDPIVDKLINNICGGDKNDRWDDNYKQWSELYRITFPNINEDGVVKWGYDTTIETMAKEGYDVSYNGELIRILQQVFLSKYLKELYIQCVVQPRFIANDNCINKNVDDTINFLNKELFHICSVSGIDAIWESLINVGNLTGDQF